MWFTTEVSFTSIWRVRASSSMTWRQGFPNDWKFLEIELWWPMEGIFWPNSIILNKLEATLIFLRMRMDCGECLAWHWITILWWWRLIQWAWRSATCGTSAWIIIKSRKCLSFVESFMALTVFTREPQELGKSLSAHVSLYSMSLMIMPILEKKRHRRWLIIHVMFQVCLGFIQKQTDWHWTAVHQSLWFLHDDRLQPKDSGKWI